MRLLRTIFIQHKHHLLHPKRCISSLLSHPFSSTSDAGNKGTGWSSYGGIFDDPVAQKRPNDHIDAKVGNFPQENPTPSDQSDAEVEDIPRENTTPSGRVKKVQQGGGGVGRKSGKVKTQWVCINCGHEAGQWWGTCASCDMVGTMKVFHEPKLGDSDDKARNGLADVVGSWLPQRPDQLRPMKLGEVNRGFNQQDWRIPLSGPFGDEVARVLGGGLVPGSLTLVSGDPGVGKSTLLLQVAALIADGHKGGEASPVVYVSGEESLQQIGHRADRLGIKSDIYLYSSTDIEDLLKKAQSLSPRALVVDSIQTVYSKAIAASAGGPVQVKECTWALMRFAKTTNIPVLLIGHVTKSGDIAGPRLLEHIVDVVLYMEGERYTTYRMLRAVKNRFGSTDESLPYVFELHVVQDASELLTDLLGVFEMSQLGFRAVSNASEMFLTEQDSGSDVLAGLAITVIMDGSRAFVIEIQALCLPRSSVSSSQLVGIQTNRANMIKCVLIKQAGLHLQENALFLNVVGGMKLEESETAGDLAIAAAICSSFLEFPIPKDIAFIGEIGLSGELRMVPRIEKRIHTVAKLGYRMCIVPKQVEKVLGTVGVENMQVVCCRNLKEFINTVQMR